jgi:hypothetical protein
MNTNSNEPCVNVGNQVALLSNLLNRNSPLLAPPHVAEALSRVSHYFGLNGARPALRREPHAQPQKQFVPIYKPLDGRRHAAPPNSQTATTATVPASPPNKNNPLIRHNVYLNRQTMISTLYIFEDINVWVEYPETKDDRPIGYLFRRDPQDWQNPAHSFVYSLGSPAGQTRREDGGCPLLTGADGKQVPYSIRSATCMTFLFFFFFLRDTDPDRI